MIKQSQRGCCARRQEKQEKQENWNGNKIASARFMREKTLVNYRSTVCKQAK
jgi:hypothetical protein